MTTSKKLWLGFGTLTALLALICTAVIARLQMAEEHVLKQADVSRPRSTATRELEIGVMRFALALRDFALTRDPRLREKALQHIHVVESQLAEYLRLAVTDRQRDMGTRFGSLWREYRDLGRIILDEPERQLTPRETERIFSLRPQIEDLLDRKMHPDALAAFDARKAEAVADLREVVGFTVVLLSLGVIIAVLTSWNVGRGIIAAERGALADGERFRLAMEATSMGVWQIDERDNRVIWSPRCREIFGLPAEGELTRAMILERIHPDDREMVVRTAEESLRKGSASRFAVEHRVVTPSGELRWVAARGRTYLDGGDSSLHTGVMLDITERKRVEEELRESVARFRRLADAMPQIVYVANAVGRIEFINQQWIAFTGQQSAETAELDQVIHPDDRESMRRQWKSAMEGETDFTAIFRLRRASDGEYRWFLTRAIPIRDAAGRVERWYGTATDIHRQKQFQEALRTSEERYRAFISNSSEGIWRVEFDPPIDTSLPIEKQVDLAYRNGRYAECNEVMARMYGLERSEDLIGKSIDFMLPESDPAAREYLASIIRNGYRALDVDSEERDAAGRKVFFANSMVGVLEEGRLKRVWGTQRDVTERKAAELALKEADRRKDEFLATLAHELRNPLAPIRNGLQILKRAEVGSSAAEHARTMMERQLKQMIRLIDDLLDVSRISRGKIQLQRKPIDLAAVVQTAVETSRPLIDSGEHSLTVEVPNRPLVVDGDATRLAQVFANLLNNAAKFSPSGGKIAIVARGEWRAPNGEATNGIDHGSPRATFEAVVSVKDSGEGIPLEMLSKVFDLFTQVDRTLERPHSGLGIGLTLVKRLIELHGGTVEAKSEGPGLGSEFVVRLPASAEGTQPADETGDDSMQRITAARRRILIADDNADAADSLAEVLAFSGDEVRTASDGLRAIEEAEAFRPDVALLDIGMPNLNGYDVCRRIREQPWGADMTIIALTGWGQEEHRRRSQEVGFDHHLVKPVAARTLMKVLEELDAAKGRTQA
jgi:PAS domain S-box-containing protein